jgi:purine-binding chemotaxis protein CheW
MLSYGLSVTQIPEILRPLPITSVPAAPDFVLGLVNWRDCPVPVIDLDTRLGLTTQANSSSHEKTRLMIARGASQKTLIGFLIQPGTRVLRLPIRHQPCTRMPALDQNMVKGVFELENEILVIPDVESMLRSDE